MKVAAKPENEAARLAALKSYNLLDTPEEKEYDDLVRLASQICDTPMSTITLIDENRQWFKAQVGMKDRETHRDFAFCAHVINQNELFEVPDATKDDRFFDNPYVTGDPDIRFYAGAPLVTPDGYNLGTLCVIDRKPKELNDEQRFALEVLSREAAKRMELKRKYDELHRLNDINHKLLSLIGHDLKTPFTSLYGLLELVEGYDLSPEDFQKFLPKVKDGFSSANELLSNLLDWASSQFSKNELRKEPIALKRIVDDIASTNAAIFERKNNKVVNQIAASSIARADVNMVKAVFRNLIINANKFTQDGSITVACDVNDDMLTIEIRDTGIGIEAEQVQRMFSWDTRTSTKGTGGERGSGFGLLVSQDFVERNGGKIWVKSKLGAGSSFYFTLTCA